MQGLGQLSGKGRAVPLDKYVKFGVRGQRGAVHQIPYHASDEGHTQAVLSGQRTEGVCQLPERGRQPFQNGKRRHGQAEWLWACFSASKASAAS